MFLVHSSGTNMKYIQAVGIVIMVVCVMQIIFPSAICLGQTADEEARRILSTTVSLLDGITTIKLSVEDRFVSAIRPDTVTSNYYLVAERDDSLRVGCKLYGFSPEGEYTLYDGERLMTGYAETGRMNEYKRGSIPYHAFSKVFKNFDMLPLPMRNNQFSRHLFDSTLRVRSIRRSDFRGEPVTIVTTTTPGDGDDLLGGETEMWIRNTDGMPLRYIEKFDINGMGQQYGEYFLSYVGVDLPVEEGLFSGVTLPQPLELLTPPEMKHRPEPPLRVGEMAPEIAARTVSGDSLRLSDFRGKVVLLDFFYSTCGPCRQAIPRLVELSREYTGKDVAILGIDSHEPADSKLLLRLLETREVRYPVLLPTKETDREYRVSGYPTVFIIGRDGRIAAVHVGFSTDESKDTWQREIDRALAEEGEVPSGAQ
jgi:peroxiredoxin